MLLSTSRLWPIAGLTALSAAAFGVSGPVLAAPRSASSAPSARNVPSAALVTCPATVPVASLPTFVRTDIALIPDDLTVDPKGDIWVGVEVQGHILDFAPDGSLRQNLPDANGPEGIIAV